MAYLYPIKIGFKSKTYGAKRIFTDLYRIKIELVSAGKMKVDQRQGDTPPRRLSAAGVNGVGR